MSPYDWRNEVGIGSKVGLVVVSYSIHKLYQMALYAPLHVVFEISRQDNVFGTLSQSIFRQ